MQKALIILVVFLLPVLAMAQWTEHTAGGDFDGARCVFAADVDGDGDMDMLGAARYDSAITWWENVDGDGLNWVEHTIDDVFSQANGVYAIDVDGDGDCDVLGAAEQADDITWWENVDGDGLNWAEHLVDGSFTFAASVFGTDVDADGDTDIIGAAFLADDITWWENENGDGLTWTEHLVDGDFDGAYYVSADDVDGDGDIDIIGAAFLADDITWWENVGGNGLNWNAHIVAPDFDGACSVSSGDVDGDGDIDLFGAGFEVGEIFWWENVDGDGLTWTGNSVSGFYDGAHSVFAQDIDGDGDTDVLTAAFGADDITWWENVDGDGSNWLENAVDGNFYGARSVFAADIDGDGDVDALGAGILADDITWWENPLVVGVEEQFDTDFPSEYSLFNVYPNPFNPTTTLQINLPNAAVLSVIVYNVSGQQVADLATGQYAAGLHSLTFDASNLTSGLYFIRAIVQGEMDQTQKVMLVR
ncbi:hypothetical protein BMS3Bbin04_00915 [bacterium BMS3Bbin04]|nr:hypothetical protein BMS3Bbin04_00915 [bacterium BMS3Bbin04]